MVVEVVEVDLQPLNVSAVTTKAVAKSITYTKLGRYCFTHLWLWTRPHEVQTARPIPNFFCDFKSLVTEYFSPSGSIGPIDLFYEYLLVGTKRFIYYELYCGYLNPFRKSVQALFDPVNQFPVYRNVSTPVVETTRYYALLN